MQEEWCSQLWCSFWYLLAEIFPPIFGNDLITDLILNRAGLDAFELAQGDAHGEKLVDLF